MKYQDIEVLLRRAQVPRELALVIQHLHAENTGLKQEISGIARGMDRMIEVMNQVLTVASVHNDVFKGMEEGMSFSDTIESLRAAHLSDIRSEATD